MSYLLRPKLVKFSAACNSLRSHSYINYKGVCHVLKSNNESQSDKFQKERAVMRNNESTQMVMKA